MITSIVTSPRPVLIDNLITSEWSPHISVDPWYFSLAPPHVLKYLGSNMCSAKIFGNNPTTASNIWTAGCSQISVSSHTLNMAHVWDFSDQFFLPDRNISQGKRLTKTIHWDVLPELQRGNKSIPGQSPEWANNLRRTFLKIEKCASNKIMPILLNIDFW